MKMQRDTLLGLVFFGGLALVGWATVSLTSISFERQTGIVVYFDNAQGLREGDPVFVLGTRSGSVQEVGLSAEKGRPPIRVVLQLTRKLPPLTANRRIEVRQANLLGGSQVDIDPGTGTPVKIEPPYQGQHKLSALEALGDADLIGMVDSIKQFFATLNDPNGAVGALLASREPFDDLAAALKSARNTMEQIEKGDGLLARIIRDKQVADDVSTGLRELREVIHKVNDGEGLAARIVNDAEMAADVSGALDDIHEMTASTRRGEGLLGRFVASAETAKKFDDTLASIQTVAGKLNDPNAGLLPALIGDPEMRTQGRNLIANLAETSDKINNGEGLLAKLINDPEMAEGLNRVINQVAGAIEDTREAAPVGTFFQVLATPF